MNSDPILFESTESYEASQALQQQQAINRMCQVMREEEANAQVFVAWIRGQS